MAVFCWGELAKSANDPTTIAEYIQSRIILHNVDPAAHGLNDYALYNHRNDEIIDHRDYSINSEKITTDQIIGKDFRTAQDVGVGVDGIKFSEGGIEVWKNGQRAVYITNEGNAKFNGTIETGEMKYLHRYVRMIFESLDMINFQSMGLYGTDIVPGRVRFDMDAGSAGDMSHMYIPTSWFAMANAPFMEIVTGEETAGVNQWYVGAGMLDNRNTGRNFVGFRMIDRYCYGFVKTRGGASYITERKYFGTGEHSFRFELDPDERVANFFVDGVYFGKVSNIYPSFSVEDLFYLEMLRASTSAAIVSIGSVSLGDSK